MSRKQNPYARRHASARWEVATTNQADNPSFGSHSTIVIRSDNSSSLTRIAIDSDKKREKKKHSVANGYSFVGGEWAEQRSD